MAGGAGIKHGQIEIRRRESTSPVSGANNGVKEGVVTEQREGAGVEAGRTESGKEREKKKARQA